MCQFMLCFDQAETVLAITGYQRVAVAFLFAIETAMRLGISAVWWTAIS